MDGFARSAAAASVTARTKSRNLAVALLGLIVIALGIALGIALRTLPAVPATPLPSVRWAAAETHNIDVDREGLGSVAPLATVIVRPQVSGKLLDVPFHEGEQVKKGDIVALIDPRPFAIALRQAEGQLAHDEALLKTAQLDLARDQTLRRQDSIARQQVDAQLSLVGQYQGTVDADRAMVDAAALNLAYCTIRAPIDGRIGLRAVDRGNIVQTTDPGGIAVIAQQQPISVVFTLPEDDLPAVLNRLRAGAKLGVAAYDRADRGKLATGELQGIDSQIDQTTGTLRLRAIFANQDAALFANQFVNAHVAIDTLQGAVTIPADALQPGPAGSFVWVIGKDGRAAMRIVQTGPQSGDRLAITHGLAAGETVVTAGTDRLREGEAVRLAPPNPGR